jgi:hypothetical protein
LVLSWGALPIASASSCTWLKWGRFFNDENVFHGIACKSLASKALAA